MSVRAAGIGTALQKVVTNNDLAQHMETSDAWIENGPASVSAGLAAPRSTWRSRPHGRHRRCGSHAGDIGFLVLCTTTPEKTFPASSAMVAAGLGITCGGWTSTSCVPASRTAMWPPTE